MNILQNGKKRVTSMNFMDTQEEDSMTCLRESMTRSRLQEMMSAQNLKESSGRVSGPTKSLSSHMEV